MRQAYYATFLSAALLAGVSACSSDEPQPQAETFFQVTQDSQTWQGTGTAIYDKGRQAFSVLSSRNLADGQTQTVSLDFTVPNVQTPVASLIGVTSRQLIGGDGITSQFTNSDALGTPTVQITRLDTAQKVIEGRFEATLQRSFTPQQELMRLSEGSFRISYEIGPVALYSTK